MIDLAKIQSLAATLPVEETTEGLSAYGLWKAYKEVFEALGLEATRTSQSFYNDAKQGRVNGTKDSRQKFTDDEAEAYIAKLVARATR